MTKTTIILMILLIAAGGFLYKKYRIAPKINFPAMELVDVEGQKVQLEQYAGKTIFLNFWASWCAPCRAEMPSMEQARKQLSDEDIVFLTITDDPIEKLVRFKREHDYAFVYWKLQGKLKDIDIHTIPTTYVIDKDGSIALTHVNGLDWSNPETVEKIRRIASK